MNNNVPDREDDAEVSDFKPLTAEEAQRLREQFPETSPWWVIAAQLAVGAFAALVAWAWVGQLSAAASSFYGAVAVALPAALFWRGVRRGAQSQTNQSAALLKFFVWELIKIVLTVALLAAAPWLIDGLNWLALVAGVVLALKMYWVALWARPGLMNRI